MTTISAARIAVEDAAEELGASVDWDATRADMLLVPSANQDPENTERLRRAIRQLEEE